MGRSLSTALQERAASLSLSFPVQSKKIPRWMELLHVMENTVNKMGHDWKETAKKGFLFSGEMTASATHEIKNSLAVIKENAGLLEDLARMSNKDRPLLPAKIIALGQRITKHVGQANKTITNMNKLAHSTDRFEASVNVVEILEFLKTITSRLTTNRGVRLTISPPGSSTGNDFVLTTSPFLFKQLVWQCICLLMEEMCDSYCRRRQECDIII